MNRIRAAAAMIIDARPEEIYSILADYHAGHPQVLNKKYFRSLEVESGGRGAGTVFRTRIRVGGVERAYHMVVSEPEQGLLVETDTSSGLVTSFIVKSVQDSKQSSVEIATEWEAKGIQGFFERLLSPPMLRRIYHEELQKLADVVKSRQTLADSSGKLPA